MLTSRREFIRTVSAAAAVSAFPSILVPRPKDKLGVALVGLGYYSTDLLAPALQLTEHCELRGIVTGTPSKIPVWQEKYRIKDKNVYNYESMHQIANNPDIDVVYIVLPPFIHMKYSVIAANAGKHVWCEKPMAMTEAECTQIIEACRSNGVQLTVGYRMQHEPNTQEIIGYAKALPYGSQKSIIAEAGYYDGRSEHWKQDRSKGGGAMYDMGVYPLNAARYASGKEPVAVTARYETARPEIYDKADETTLFDLEFEGGLMANCKTSLGENVNMLRVDCDKGWYYLSPFQQYSGISGMAGDGITFSDKIPNQQARQMDDDSIAIKEKRKPIVPGEEGRRDIRIVEAIFESAENGERRILL